MTEQSASPPASGGPLSGLTMLSLQNMPPVGSAGYVLAEMGMDVIQIEAVALKPMLGGLRESDDPSATAFDVMGRNKRSVALDLKSDAGREAFYALAERADVILEGFRPGTAARLGIGYEDISARSPSIVYCSLSGFGQTSPYADLPMHDTECCAMGGALSQNVGADGVPVPYGVLLSDTAGGLHAVAAILAALLHRQQTGVGQYLDVSMTGSLFTFQLHVVGEALRLGKAERPRALDLGAFRCADGNYIAAGNTGAHLWARFCTALELPELASVSYDGPGWDEALAAIHARIATKSSDEWFEILRPAGASVGPMRDLVQVMADPDMLSSGAVIEVDHPELGKLRHPGFPVNFSETPVAFRRFASAPGADTEAVLREVGVAGSADG